MVQVYTQLPGQKKKKNSILLTQTASFPLRNDHFTASMERSHDYTNQWLFQCIWACEYCIKKDLKKVQIYPLTETRIKVHEVTVTEDDGTKIKRMMEKKSFLGPQLGNQNPSCVHFWMRTAQGDAKAPTKASALSVSLKEETEGGQRNVGGDEQCTFHKRENKKA